MLVKGAIDRKVLWKLKDAMFRFRISNRFDSWQDSRSLACKLPKWCEGINTQSHYIARSYGKTCVGLRLSDFPVILCLSFVSDSPWARHVNFGYWYHLGRIILILIFWLGICPQSQKMGDSSAAAVAFHLCRSCCINARRSPSENINVSFCVLHIHWHAIETSECDIYAKILQKSWQSLLKFWECPKVCKVLMRLIYAIEAQNLAKIYAK